MRYQSGDYVYPVDLPNRFLCRVEQAECLPIANGSAEVLRLIPLEGPWSRNTVLIRLGEAVMPVEPDGSWQRAGGVPTTSE